MTEDEEIKIKNIKRPVTFHKIYATNVTGDWTDYDFRLEFFNEKMKIKEDVELVDEEENEEEEQWFYFSEAMVILAPKAVRRLKNVIDKAVKEYDDGPNVENVE